MPGARRDATVDDSTVAGCTGVYARPGMRSTRTQLRSGGISPAETLVAFATLALAACSATVSPGATSSSTGFRLTSPAFRDDAAIPARHTCDGPDVSPPLVWSGAPADTRAFALLVSDPDARGFVHWPVVDLPATASGLAEGASPGRTGGVEGRNDFGRNGWGGPCPPSGTHRYTFELYALAQPLGLPPGFRAGQLRDAVRGRALGVARLTGTYRRG